MNRTIAILVGAILASLVGCRAAEDLPGIVKGRVVNQGKPVTEANIYFEKVDGDHSVFATLDADGVFQIKTNVSGGLPAGAYRISFRPNPATKTVLVGDEAPKLVHPLIPERFLDPKTSDLSVQVRSGDNPPFDFDLGK